MKKLSYLLILSGLVSVPAIAADAPASPHSFAYNVGVTTDYIFRGISQSQHDPAISGGIDYSHTSGLYAGTWLSTQKWVKAQSAKTGSDFELDIYGGYKGEVGDIGYDVGLIHYQYDGKKTASTTGLPTPDTTEAYLGASWKMLSVKYSHTISRYFVGWGDVGTVSGNKVSSKGSNYLELNATHDLGDGWGLLGHIGYQKVKNLPDAASGLPDASYTDWKVGVTKDVGFGTVTLAYSDTDADGAVAYRWSGKDVSKGVLALSFSKSF
jgi:uncharacterized protein (TIGR02001 family)